MTRIRDPLIAIQALSRMFIVLPLAVTLPCAAKAEGPDVNNLRKEQLPHQTLYGSPQSEQVATDQLQRRPQHHQSVRFQSSRAQENNRVNGVPIGRYFQDFQIEKAKSHFGRPENMGFCPPGLAKKDNGCLPPGHAKQWRKGAALPATVIYYDAPRSVVMLLGTPPRGYKYVRVASDILLIALGTSVVMDVIEDVVH